MRQSVFDYIDNLDTLLAVIVGAVLATGGAMVAELVQDRLGQKRKERDAARFFGEILASVDRVLDRAIESMAIGERWGDVTLRLFRTALNEAAIYERNRERLFELRDMQLRQDIHVHFLTEMVPLVALNENSREIAELEKELKHAEALSEDKRATIEEDLETLRTTREGALNAVMAEHAKTESICKRLEPLAGVTF
ncbi:MAG: hypothetical protein JJ931_06360 [Henriciella sp.]|jgi:hypothetical protein|nr:hypothetical protein [Henriciella sp.]MBO6695020.1 hypothetical protein [Henriciella sp.]